MILKLFNIITIIEFLILTIFKVNVLNYILTLLHYIYYNIKLLRFTFYNIILIITLSFYILVIILDYNLSFIIFQVC